MIDMKNRIILLSVILGMLLAVSCHLNPLQTKNLRVVSVASASLESENVVSGGSDQPQFLVNKEKEGQQKTVQFHGKEYFGEYYTTVQWMHSTDLNRDYYCRGESEEKLQIGTDYIEFNPEEELVSLSVSENNSLAVIDISKDDSPETVIEKIKTEFKDDFDFGLYTQATAKLTEFTDFNSFWEVTFTDYFKDYRLGNYLKFRLRENGEVFYFVNNNSKGLSSAANRLTELDEKEISQILDAAIADKFGAECEYTVVSKGLINYDSIPCILINISVSPKTETNGFYSVLLEIKQ